MVEAQKKRPMNPSKILELVKQGADARLGETVERLLLNLRYHHTHQSWRKECGCEYCRFINSQYTHAKLYYHQLKKKHNILEATHWDATDAEIVRMHHMEEMMLHQKSMIRNLREHKKDLQQKII